MTGQDIPLLAQREDAKGNPPAFLFLPIEPFRRTDTVIGDFYCRRFFLRKEILLLARQTSITRFCNSMTFLPVVPTESIKFLRNTPSVSAWCE